MTELLQQALDELEGLTPVEQDAIAALILDELRDEKRWDETFARSQEKLARLAQQAREAAGAGRVQSGGWDDL